MNRQEHLAFCKKCLNRKFDPQKGLICKLTDKIADFEDNCENFDVDESVKEEVIEETKHTTEIIAELPDDIKEKLLPHQDLIFALVGGFFVSIICAIIWAAITVATEYQIAYMALGVGLLVGFGVRFFGAGIDQIYGVIGGLFALIGCLLGNLFSQVGFYANMQGLGYFDTLSMLDLSSIVAVMADSFSPIDLLFYGFATYEGYKFAFRQIPEDYTNIKDFTPSFSKLRLPIASICLIAILFSGYKLSQGISGEQTFYYDSGEKQMSGKYVNGVEHGSWEYYYENGGLSIEGEFDNGKEVGLWTWYYESGTPYKKANYINGLFDGPWFLYHENGYLADSSTYVMGRLEGPSKTFYVNGQLEKTGSYHRDHAEGHWTYYHPNGNKSSEGNAKNGSSSGLWKNYDINGQLTEEVKYVDETTNLLVNLWKSDGQQLVVDGNGEFASYYENGQLKESGPVKDGKRVGNWKSFYEDGTPEYETKFEDDEFILLSHWTVDGEKDVENGNGYYVTFYPGTTTTEDSGEFKNGLKEGEWLSYYPVVELIKQESHFKNGKLDGPFVTYFENGLTYVEGNYVNDMKEGEWTWYYETGGVQCTVTYVKDKKQGRQVFWTEMGLEAKEEIYDNGEFVSESLL